MDTKINTILTDKNFMEFIRWFITTEQYNISNQSAVSLINNLLLKDPSENMLNNITDEYRSNIEALFLYNDFLNGHTFHVKRKKAEKMVDNAFAHIWSDIIKKINTLYCKQSKNSYILYKNLLKSSDIYKQPENNKKLSKKIDALLPLINRWLSLNRFESLVYETSITPEHITFLGEKITEYNDQQLNAILFWYYSSENRIMYNYPKWPLEHIKILWDTIYAIPISTILTIYRYVSAEQLQIIHQSRYNKDIYTYENWIQDKQIHMDIRSLIFMPSDVLKQYISDLDRHENIEQFFDTIQSYINDNQGKVMEYNMLSNIQHHHWKNMTNIGQLPDDILQSLRYIFEIDPFYFKDIILIWKDRDHIPLLECLSNDSVKNLLDNKKPAAVFAHVIATWIKHLDTLSTQEFTRLQFSLGTKIEKIAELYKQNPPKQVNKEPSDITLMNCFKELSLEQLYTIKTANLLQCHDKLKDISSLSVKEIQNIWNNNIAKISIEDIRSKLFSRTGNN